METALENVKLLNDARELVTDEAWVLMEADLNFFDDLNERGDDWPFLLFEKQLDPLKDQLLERVDGDLAEALDNLIGIYPEMMLSAYCTKVDAAFLAGWLFGSGQREVVLKVVKATPARIEEVLHLSLDHHIKRLEKQVAGLQEASSVVKLGVVPDDGAAT